MLLTRLPLGIATSFDLHVLGTPPALILSQDQTLHYQITEPFEALLLAQRQLMDQRDPISTFAVIAHHKPTVYFFVLRQVDASKSGGAGIRTTCATVHRNITSSRKKSCCPETHRLVRYCTVQFSKSEPRKLLYIGRYKQPFCLAICLPCVTTPESRGAVYLAACPSVKRLNLTF